MIAERKLQQLHRNSHHKRKGKGTSYKELTSREETMTSTSHLGLQCNDNMGAQTVLYNTTATTTGAHPVASKTTSKRKKTSWSLAFTSTTSTSRMESATSSTYHNHVYQHLQSSMVLHLLPQNGLVNFEHTSTSVSLRAHRPLGLRLRRRSSTYN